AASTPARILAAMSHDAFDSRARTRYAAGRFHPVVDYPRRQRVLRLESRKSLIVFVAALFVFNLFLGFHHQGALVSAGSSHPVTALGVSADADRDGEHSSGCRICQWTSAERAEVPRPLLLGDALAVADAVAPSISQPACEPVVSLLRSRAPPR